MTRLETSNYSIETVFLLVLSPYCLSSIESYLVYESEVPDNLICSKCSSLHVLCDVDAEIYLVYLNVTDILQDIQIKVNI